MKYKFENNTKVISCIKLNIKSMDIKNNFEKYQKMMIQFTKDFLDEQFYNGDKLLEYAKKKNIEIGDSFIILKHDKGTALVNICSYSTLSNVEVSAAINIDICSNFLNGFSFNRGSFSDVYCILKNEYIWFDCRDILIMHNLFLVWVFEKLEENFYTDYKFDIIFKQSCNDQIYFYFLDYDRNLFRKLNNLVKQKINVNKSIKINTLKVDGLTILEYCKKNDMHRYLHLENDIFKICLLYGKPYKQVKKYIEKNLKY